MPAHRPTTTQLAAVAAIALAVRLPGLWWGLPGPTHLFSYHPDEYHSLRGALALSQGDLNPHFFNYGCLYLYAVAVGAEVFSPRLFARLSGAWGAPDPAGVLATVPAAIGTWTLAARVLSLIAGVATAVVVAAAAAAMGFSGWWGGMAVALAPFHALLSRYGTVDPTLTLFVALTLLLTALGERGGPRLLVAAGAAGGLAASTKYTGVLALAIPLVAIAADRSRPVSARLRVAGAAVGAAAAAFLATSPYVLLAWPEASRDILFEMRHMRHGEYPAFVAEPSGLWFHVKWLLLGTCGLAAMGAAGLVAAMRRSATPRASLAAALTATAWLAAISGTGVRYARYELPLLPLLAVGVAAAVAMAPRCGRFVAAAAVALAVAALGLAAAHCAYISVVLCRPDTRDQALGHILQNSAPDQSVGLIWEPWFQSPPVDFCNGGAALRRLPLWAALKRPRRPLEIIGYDARRLTAARPAWLAISEVEIRDYLRAGDEKARRLMDAVGRHYRLEKRLGWSFGQALMPPGLAPPQDWLYPAMPLRLYRLAR